VFEVVAFGHTPPARVLAQGQALPRLPSLAELEAAGAGWTLTAETGGSLFVKVGPGEQRIEVVP
ncbi:MAG TPA: hypothetical protein P5076_20500, partial [Myxococcota bacterium]|nr:hypothetical protein [Myxococcota bacterium]